MCEKHFIDVMHECISLFISYSDYCYETLRPLCTSTIQTINTVDRGFSEKKHLCNHKLKHFTKSKCKKVRRYQFHGFFEEFQGKISLSQM